VVPGNEQAVNRVINDLTRQGVSVIDESRARVHVSGHATKNELLQIYNLVKPANVMPVHGEPRHQHANARIANSTGISMSSIKVVDDGVVVDVTGSKAEIVGAVPCGLVYVDGASVGSSAEASLKDRRVLAAEGFLSVISVVDLIDRRVIAEPEVHARGLSEDSSLFKDLAQLVGEELESALKRDVTDISELQRIVRKTAGTWVNKQRGRRPMIIPVVIEA
jgi:ribonuclease J